MINHHRQVKRWDQASIFCFGCERQWPSSHGHLTIAHCQLGERAVSCPFSEGFELDSGPSYDYPIGTRHRLPSAGKRT
jgi:hypothetical protein